MANEISVEIIARIEKAEKALDDLKKKAQKTGEAAGDGFTDNLEGAIGSLKDLRGAASSGFDGLVGGFKKVGIAAVAFGATIYALKTAIDLAFEGEKIRAVENQFNVLTARAGVAGDALQAAFEKAGGGMVDTTDIMISANRALIELGDNARDLPGLFELARKGSQVFGGEVTANFEKLTTAIASGNARSLRSIGIFVDSDTALRSYAKSMGTTVEHLSQFGKQQAILNAVLEKGESAFKGVDLNATRSANAFQKLKVAMADMGDTVKTAFESVFGPTMAKIGEQLASLAQSLNLQMKAKLGNDAEQTAAKMKILSNSIDQLIRDEQRLKDQMAKSGEDEFSQAALDNVRAMLKENRQKLDLMREENRLLESNRGIKNAMNADIKKPSIEDAQKVAADQEKLTSALQAGLAQRLAAQAAYSQAQGLDDEATALRQFAIEQNANMKLLELKRTFQSASLQNTMQFKELEKQIIEQKNIEMAMADQKRLTTMNALNSGMLNAIGKTIAMTAQAMGSALVKGSKAFEGFGLAILGMLADIAIQTGMTLIMAGLGMEALRVSIVGMTGGPALFAGIALVALGGLLKSLSGGGGSESTSGASSGDSGGGISSTPMVTEVSDTEQAKPNTNVQVVIQGLVAGDKRAIAQEIAEVINEGFGGNGMVIASGT